MTTNSNKKSNEEAEKAVLGIALSGGDITELVRKLNLEDFTNAHNQLVYETVKSLNDQGVAVEPIAVATSLREHGVLNKLPNGVEYITDLYASSPSATSASYYMKVLKDATAYRNISLLGELAQHMVNPSAGESFSPAEVIANLSSRIESLAEENLSNELVDITSVLDVTLQEVAALQKGEGVSGMPTGFKDLDYQLNGLQPGQMIVIAARPGVGKALALDTPIPTPYGLRTMGQIKTGDVVYGSSGEPTYVVQKSEIMSGRDCYRVSFSTGESIVCDGEHRWQVLTQTSPRGEQRNDNSGRLGLPQGDTVTVLTAEMMWEMMNKNDAGLGVRFTISAPPKNRASKRWREVEVVRIVKVPSVPVQCLQVEAEDHLFLVGRTRIPTHNSSLALDIARNAAVRQNKSVIVFSLEMSAPELGMRALGAEGYIDLRLMKIEGGMDEHKWSQMQAAAERLHGKKLAIEDNPNVTMEDIKAKARLWKRKHGLDLIVIDYIQLMNASRKLDARQQEVSEISRAIKLLAKELEIPVIALSQLNRSSEQRADKRPSLSDLRESGAIEQDADIVLLIHREEVHDMESPRAGEADIIVAKNRSGPTGNIVLSWLGKFSRFDNRTL